MSFTTRRNSGTTNTFCKVCYDAGLSIKEYTSHFVKDQPGPNGRVVCPTLLAQKCLICGVPGHTSSYCPDNSSVSSSSSTVQNPRFKMATDDIRHPPHSVRLPPIQKQAQQQQLYRPAPRIVYANELPQKNPVDARREFPSLPNLSSLRRFENDEPQMKREMPVAAEASPVHSPPVAPIKLKYNKKSNPFGALANNVDSGDDSDHETSLPPVQKKRMYPHPHHPHGRRLRQAAANQLLLRHQNNNNHNNAHVHASRSLFQLQSQQPPFLFFRP